MANPFKEAEKKNKKAPGSGQEPVVEKKEVVEAETPAEPEKPVEAPVKPVVAIEEKEPAPKKAEKKTAEPKKKEVAPTAQPARDIFAGLDTEKASGKTYAFYLSTKNAEKLKAMAEKKGTSTSKLLDHILSEIL